MSHGLANTLTLYDDAGNPVQVVLENGQYMLASSDKQTHDSLDEIKLLLSELVILLGGRPQ